MYGFEFDPGTGILRSKLRGHWSLAVAARYCEELGERIVEARRSVGRLRLMVDATQHGSQTAEVIEYVFEHGGQAARLPSDRIAVCVTSLLGRHWAGRSRHEGATAGSRNMIFSSVASARAWLLDRGETLSSAA